MIFFRNRTLPPYPSSLVKLALREASSIFGSLVSTPMRDQVPELINAQSFPSAGTATTAAPVSCEQLAETWQPVSPVSDAISLASGAKSVPERTTDGKSFRGQPRCSITGADHTPFRGSKICVVLALLSSATASPLSKKLK